MKPSGYGVDRGHRYGQRREHVLNVRMSDKELAAVDALVAHHKAKPTDYNRYDRYGIRTRSQLIVHLVEKEAERVEAELAKTPKTSKTKGAEEESVNMRPR